MNASAEERGLWGGAIALDAPPVRTIWARLFGGAGRAYSVREKLKPPEICHFGSF